MKSISVGELRQNPTAMLDDVVAGETYSVTRHHREIARIVPTSSSSVVIPPKVSGPSHMADRPRIELPEGLTIDQLIDELKGEW